MESERRSAPVQLVIDFAKLIDIASVGVRRAAAFLAIGLSATENYVPTSLALERDSMWHFFPDPVAESVGKDAVTEGDGECSTRA